jgi:2-methylisocitrate lyase-like PEP mutase family enzyme
LVDTERQCTRIAAAREAADRRGVPLVINARTDTFLLGLGADVDERIALTVDRGASYLRAGADLVFVPLLVDPSVVARLASGLKRPVSLMALPGAPPAGELFAAGAARVSIGQMGMLAALGTLKAIADELIQLGTWRSIERTFYGFGEAETLLAPRAPEAAVAAGSVQG